MTTTTTETATIAKKKAPHHHWTDDVLPCLAVLLQAARYPADEAEMCLRFTQQHLLRNGALGHRTPSTTAAAVTWPSYLTDDHTPIEYSIDIDAASGSSKVRYAFEPEPCAGDGYNVQAPRAWLKSARQSASLAHIDTTWHDVLSSALVIDNVAAAKGLTQHMFAVDLNATAPPMLKSYVLLDAPRRVLGERETIRRIDECMLAMGLGTPWRTLQTYLHGVQHTGKDNGARLEFISVDCRAPSQARCKPYVRFSNLARGDLLRHVRMGNALDNDDDDDESAAYAHLCADVWDTLCGREAAVCTHDQASLQERTHGAIFYYEMRANSGGNDNDHAVRIQPKVYLPVRHLLDNDEQIARRIDAVLTRHGGQTGWYSTMMAQFAEQRKQSLVTTSGMQTMLGVAIKNGKPSVSVYLNPKSTLAVGAKK